MPARVECSQVPRRSSTGYRRVRLQDGGVGAVAAGGVGVVTSGGPASGRSAKNRMSATMTTTMRPSPTMMSVCCPRGGEAGGGGAGGGGTTGRVTLVGIWGFGGWICAPDRIRVYSLSPCAGGGLVNPAGGGGACGIGGMCGICGARGIGGMAGAAGMPGMAGGRGTAGIAA